MLISPTFAIGTALISSALLLGLNPDNQPTLPVGHPAVSMPTQGSPDVKALPEDVDTIESIINAYYSSVSGAKGQTRDWNRFLSLFSPDARFMMPRVVDGQTIPLALSPDEFVSSNKTYFERGGYYEQDIHHKIDTFGKIAQVFSTYASRRSLDAPEPYARGINSFQLMLAGDRWWIITVMWDSENPKSNPIPAAYLPGSNSENKE